MHYLRMDFWTKTTQSMINQDLLVAGILLIVASILLVIHHWYKHRPGGPDPLEYPDRCFQESDVCNFHSPNHEQWILAFFLIGFIMILVACYMYP